MSDALINRRIRERELLWDMLRHSDMFEEGVQEHFGLSPASLDVLTMEHAASDTRLVAIQPLLPHIANLCEVGAKLSHRAILNYQHLGPEDIEYEDVVKIVTTALTTAVVAQLASSGMISLRRPDHD